MTWAFALRILVSMTSVFTGEWRRLRGNYAIAVRWYGKDDPRTVEALQAMGAELDRAKLAAARAEVKRLEKLLGESVDA